MDQYAKTPAQKPAPPRARAARSGPEEGNARQTIMNAAARLFARLGYDGASMRDIARASDIRASSAYHHFPSKEALFVAVYGAGIEAIYAAVTRAIAGVSDPWDRLEAAAVAHLEALLEAGDFAAVSTPYFPAALEKARDGLRQQRDQYERVIVGLVAALPLAAEIDRKIFRLHLLGALNWVPTWYRPGRQSTPAAIARQLVLMVRHGAQDALPPAATAAASPPAPGKRAALAAAPAARKPEANGPPSTPAPRKRTGKRA